MLSRIKFNRLQSGAARLKTGARYAVANFDRRRFVRQAAAVFVATLIFAISMFQQHAAHAASLTLNLDMQPLFDGINTYLPIFFLIFAIPGGIVIAMLIAKLVINSVRAAFEGGRI